MLFIKETVWMPATVVIRKLSSVLILSLIHISRKMCRYPVQNDSDSGPVQVVHEILKILSIAIAGRRRIITGYLIAPAPVKGMLRNAHQLNMCIPHVLHIGCKLLCKLPVGLEAVPRSSLILLP